MLPYRILSIPSVCFSFFLFLLCIDLPFPSQAKSFPLLKVGSMLVTEHKALSPVNHAYTRYLVLPLACPFLFNSSHTPLSIFCIDSLIPDMPAWSPL